jgi:hypothetical protein
MKWTGILNLRRISGQIAALVVISVVGLHLVFTASFLIHRPDHRIRRSTVDTLSSPYRRNYWVQRPRRIGRGCSPISSGPFHNSASKYFRQLP